MNKSLWFGLMITIGLLAGCGYLPRGDTVHVNYYGTIEESSEFRMDGYLASEGGSPERDAFSNITIRLYTAEGSLISSHDLGELSADHGRLNVSVTEDTVPTYVVFTSPDFWTEPMSVPYYIKEDGEYVLHEATSRDEMPVTTS